MLESSERSGCEGCGSAQVPGLAQWHRRCPSCGLETAAFTAHIDERDGPDIDEDQRELALRPIREANFDTLLAWLKAQTGAGGGAGAQRPRLLDVGCAHGWFLEKAAADFEVFGIEPDPEVARRTMARGLPVRRGYFPDALAADERFDVIVFNDVLEHIPDVTSALRHCRERLRPNGVVVVNAPDRRGALYRIAGTMARLGMPGPFDRLWQKGLPSPHLYYFDTASLAAVAGRAGLRVTASRRLPTLLASGLYERIMCSGDVSRAKAMALTVGILPLVPALRALPSDITVWLLAEQATS
ncbi:methyltransferase domain-containing protein [Lysobacter enzymogenes]|uniref:Methyltransferase domain-containing protein n=1 Tax=Lysobacter enzymogenes TaxID=69 RepID=A0A3N2RJY1_LYSEN|nr:methyltransferase domain-containing protein [Lysobacter enzymogenes]ROU07646.1 methyltransferase domain-containing protein [Lysobacter enzymogenes]